MNIILIFLFKQWITIWSWIQATGRNVWPDSTKTNYFGLFPGGQTNEIAENATFLDPLCKKNVKGLKKKIVFYSDVENITDVYIINPPMVTTRVSPRDCINSLNKYYHCDQFVLVIDFGP